MKNRLFAALACLALLTLSPVPLAPAATHNEREGFFGATPVDQPAATVTTRAALESLGLVATAAPTAATATADAATASAVYAVVTTEALTTAAGADYTLTLTNPLITANTFLSVSVDNGTNSTAGLAVGRISPAGGSAVILVRNTHASAALNGTLKLRVAILR